MANFVYVINEVIEGDVTVVGVFTSLDAVKSSLHDRAEEVAEIGEDDDYLKLVKADIDSIKDVERGIVINFNLDCDGVVDVTVTKIELS